MKLILASVLSLVNIILAASLNLSPQLAEIISKTVSVWGVFALFVVSFAAVCYVGWWAYCRFAENLDPAGACITGFAIPVITAFLATLGWSALAAVGRFQASEPDQYLGRFDQMSLFMIFAIFMVGGVFWGAFMKTPEYDNKTQENVAAGYTVISYWFGFIIFSWVWMIMDRLI